MYEGGFSREDILQLYRFIDWVLTLPAELEQRFLTEIQDREEERKMPYVTSAERIGIEKGIQQGIQQGTRQGEATLLIKLLEHLAFWFAVSLFWCRIVNVVSHRTIPLLHSLAHFALDIIGN